MLILEFTLVINLSHVHNALNHSDSARRYESILKVYTNLAHLDIRYSYIIIILLQASD